MPRNGRHGDIPYFGDGVLKRGNLTPYEAESSQWPLGYVALSSKLLFSNSLPRQAGWPLAVKLLTCATATNEKLEQLEGLRSEIPPAAPCLPTLVIQIRSRVKTRQSQSYKFEKFAKNSIFLIWQKTLYATHPLKLLDKMHKYEMDPIKTVDATERTRDADGRTDRRTTDGVKPIYPPPPPQQLRCARGIINIDPGECLMPSGNKPLPGLMLT